MQPRDESEGETDSLQPNHNLTKGVHSTDCEDSMRTKRKSERVSVRVPAREKRYQVGAENMNAPNFLSAETPGGSPGETNSHTFDVTQVDFGSKTTLPHIGLPNVDDEQLAISYDVNCETQGEQTKSGELDEVDRLTEDAPFRP